MKDVISHPIYDSWWYNTIITVLLLMGTVTFCWAMLTQPEEPQGWTQKTWMNHVEKEFK